MQAAFRDRPQTPLDLATYWTEYVLKHEDLSFMNPMTYQPRWIFVETWFSLLWAWLTTVTFSMVLFTSSVCYIKSRRHLSNGQ